jgi:S1-C subfamily serine protease
MNQAAIALEHLPDLIKDVRAGVVHVEFEGTEGVGNGSGFMIEPLAGDSAGGVVVTNAHVARGASRLWVRLYDGSEAEATIRVCDDSTDLALLAIPLEASRTLSLRKLADVRVGEFVIAIGSPYGLEGTVTAGIISGLERTMPGPNRVPIENMLQSDALINPGNSGGPLISLDGCVVGVNDQTILSRETGSSGLGFAIPSDTVRLVYEEIIETGNDYVIRASLSTRTTLRPFTHEERRHYSQKAGAIVVADPTANTPAASAGLRQGDIIVSFNGNVVDEPGDLYAALNRKVIGRECELEFLRDQQRHRVTIVPRERPNPTMRGH